MKQQEDAVMRQPAGDINHGIKTIPYKPRLCFVSEYEKHGFKNIFKVMVTLK